MDRSHARTGTGTGGYIILLLCMIGLVYVHAKLEHLPASLHRKAPLNRPGADPAAGLGRFSANPREGNATSTVTTTGTGAGPGAGTGTGTGAECRTYFFCFWGGQVIG